MRGVQIHFAHHVCNILEKSSERDANDGKNKPEAPASISSWGCACLSY